MNPKHPFAHDQRSVMSIQLDSVAPEPHRHGGAYVTAVTVGDFGSELLLFEGGAPQFQRSDPNGLPFFLIGWSFLCHAVAEVKDG